MIFERIIKRGVKDAYFYDFNRPKKQWHEKIFVGKFRFNQRRIYGEIKIVKKVVDSKYGIVSIYLNDKMYINV